MTPVSTVTSVSTASLIGIIFTLTISMVAPVVACIAVLLKWRGRVNVSSFFFGAGAFILSAMILERIFHTIILGATGTLITGNLWLYALYGGLAAGLFEETGRFAAMKFCMKKTLSRENAILYGIGHGGTEAILIIGFTYINNLIYSLLINSGALPSLLSAYDADTQALLTQQLGALSSTPSLLFFLAGIERIAAMLLHIALSFLVYLAVKNHKPGFYVLSIALHAFMNAGIVIISSLISPLLSEIVLIGTVLLLILLLLRYEKKKTANNA